MIIQEKWIQPFLTWRLWAMPFAMSIVLIAVAQYNFLTFHTLAELFAIVISFTMFAFAWSTYDFSKNSFLLFLACGYFWIGSLDLMHTFVYKGMNLFVHDDGNISTQFWIATRYFEALILLTAPFFAQKHVDKYKLISIFGAISISLALLVLSGHFPLAYIDGVGLTAFKVNSEYIIDGILVVALICLYRQGRSIPIQEKALITASIVMTMCAELAFTFFVSVYGVSNLAGHIFKLFSFWFIFHAIVVHNLKGPYGALQKSERRFKDFANSASDWFWEMDSDLRFTFISDRFEEVAQSENSKCLGQHRWDIANPAEPQTKWDRHKVLLKAHMPFRNFEYSSISGDGEVIYFSTSGIPIFNDDHVFMGYRGSAADITERKLVEEDLQNAKIAADAANKAKTDFLASMSHELRTPMNAVLGFAQLLQFDKDNPLSKSQTEYLDYIIDGGNHLLALINELLDLTRIEADQASFTLEKVNANETVKSSISIMDPLGVPRKISIIDDFTHGPVSTLRTDQRRFKQVLINLLNNAVKYNNDQGTITVTGEETDHGFLRVSVTDTGIGIAAEDQNDIFQMFYRLNSDPMVAREGTGVGLAVTKLLVERMAGTIGFDSTLGKGSTFWFELPLASNETTLIWTEAMHVGVAMIDSDHQRLVKLLNKVSTRTIGDEDVNRVITDLIDYTVYHFKREEILMQVCGYRDYDNHKAIHEALLAKIFKLAESWKNDPNLKTLDELRLFIRNWLYDHILNVDTTITPYTHGREKLIDLALEELHLDLDPELK